MSMYHKAYSFDWLALQGDNLPELLHRALVSGDPAELASYIDANRNLLKDPNEGDPLEDDWEELLENRDVHEYGDYALTRFYEPDEEYGLGYSWRRLDEALKEECRFSLLGFPIGPEENRFDPCGYGAYFQTPEQIAQSLSLVGGIDFRWLDDGDKVCLRQVLGLLKECVADGLGLYVTF